MQINGPSSGVPTPVAPTQGAKSLAYRLRHPLAEAMKRLETPRTPASTSSFSQDLFAPYTPRGASKRPGSPSQGLFDLYT